ncbi:splicing factor 3A subunit 1-like isoform X1 [Photinus pyralis]|uniref:splicing factor 3A subunit 1-like isoform X1 n=1 Tax=Photinus pyralis TaxID=7054 RepID=UPI00126777F8|nr:splicing factor 3A subunit 1-like isoform X1 [Photinus pyralis]
MPVLEVIPNGIPAATTIVETTETPQESSSAPINPIVGIIYPPPEVRNIVDKTASFVARNGPEFEARIRQNELGNPKFNFLNTGDPYHAYYQHKVNDFREGKTQDTPAALPGAIAKLTVSASAQQKQQEILKSVEQPFIPKEPPTDFEFIADPPSISALDLDIVKLTAQFVARNGRQFLTQLMNREQRNFQFDFLRPQHSLFQYFTKLLEQYTKVLIPPKGMQQRLRDDCKSAQGVMENSKYRAEWHKYQEAQRAREEEILERERVAYAQIDWHDFVVVETVDYQQFEIGNFPPPTTPEEVGARLLIQERIEEGEDIEMQLESDEEDATTRNDEGLSHMVDRTGHRKDDNRVQDMEEESSDEDGEPRHGTSMQPPLPPIPDKVIVKKYDPKQGISAFVVFLCVFCTFMFSAHKPVRPVGGDDYLISPITGEKIPASKVQEHMRIGLLDPRWVEQRDKHVTDKMSQDTVYAAGSAIDASLKQLAERRTDIFGVGDEETAIGKKIGEEDVRKDEKVTWDGHTSSVEAATRAARANITLEEQIHQIHKVKGLLPDEEKEKIGPKNVLTKASAAAKAAAIISAKPQANPNPTPVKAPSNQPPQMGLTISTQGSILAQSPIMMMPTSIRAPPPLMMAAPPMAGYVTTMSHMTPVGAVNVKHPLEASMEDEPSNKKMRNEDSLIPEEVFLARNTNPVSIKVTIPLQPEKTEWKLAGQLLTFIMPLSETVGNLKAKVQEDTAMPPAKQKLFYDGMFFKDSNTLAYYNITTGAIIQLQIKERGGRKK